MAEIKAHDITLRADRIVLRPMAESDWNLIHKWDNDPEVLSFCEGSGAHIHAIERTKEIYRGISEQGFCFIVEFDGEPIGFGWLRRMDLDGILKEFPGKDVRRIDLTIGEKAYWGRGIGTVAIDLMTEFGFEFEEADVLVTCDVGDHNPRGRMAFDKNGYAVWREHTERPECKTGPTYDLLLRREDYRRREE